MSSFEISLLVVLLVKVSLCIVGSFRGWNVWPWILWIGGSIGSGIMIGILEVSGSISDDASAAACLGIGAIVLIGLIYMACKRRYPKLSKSDIKAVHEQLEMV